MTDPIARFDWQAVLRDGPYASFPEAGERPVIGITANYGDRSAMLTEQYYKAVVAAGGTPVLIPPVADTQVAVNTLARVDGLLLSGGADINPLYAGEEPSPALRDINAERDLPELLLTRLAYNRQIPTLGICRGIQMLAMALGGRVEQDILSAQRPGGQGGGKPVKHSQEADRSLPTHTVAIERGSILHALYRSQAIAVNSFHHQAVADAGGRFRVTATAPDGTVEAIESREFKSVMGVQWHPECMAEGQPIFRWLVKQAAHFREANRLHDRIVTLDTHCDTPMLFAKGVDFARRDSRILVDLHKMTEGRLDATIMVAYLPQPGLGETFSGKVDCEVDGPTQYADLIFDKIEAIVAAHKDCLSIARTPADLYSDKRHGRKSIMLGIENGLALGGSLAAVKHFKQRGVVYITLCHNGDNDLCDSARGCNTHNGVSPLGEQVIREMNRLGIMVDLSHGGEKSFYDALAISSKPIVCSHSSARALCDHPRNLTDDQMRALAARGGVAQTTLYHGFLRSAGEATILDAVAHLEHAIHVMGVDHVGIGTDFDGDGGVRGMADASEAINFTRMLLARHYSERDIQKIWGGNFMRVMGEVQAV